MLAILLAEYFAYFEPESVSGMETASFVLTDCSISAPVLGVDTVADMFSYRRSARTSLSMVAWWSGHRRRLTLTSQYFYVFFFLSFTNTPFPGRLGQQVSQWVERSCGRITLDVGGEGLGGALWAGGGGRVVAAWRR